MLVVIGIILSQRLTQQQVQTRKPGPERNDLVPTESTLPARIGNWQRVQFLPGCQADLLPEGQFWWSFSWIYHNEYSKLSALVSLDQADWKDWHELTECYRGIGWKLRNRDVSKLTKIDEVCVVAEFERPPAEIGTLIFSEFDETGSLLTSPWDSISLREENQPDQSFMETLVGRLTWIPVTPVASARTYERIIQVQVFLPKERPLTPAERDSLIELHEKTLDSFRDAWQRHLTESPIPGTL